MRRSTLWMRPALLAVLVMIPALASAASPTLTLIQPRGAQRGTEVELTFSGARLEDAQEILFYTPGFEVVKIEPVNANAIKATVKIAADCRLGEHVVQVRGASGISDFRTFFVGPYPEIQEKEPNNDFDEPQPIDLNVTVSGVVQNEDVDYFVVEAKKGQRITAEVEGMRLGTALFDPYLAILDERRFELAAEDDTTLVGQDAVVSIVAPEDGKYIIEVRESAYGGNGNCRYRLHVGTFPRPTAVYPAGGKLGEEVEVRFLGDPAGEFTRRVQLPSVPVEEFGLFPEDEGGIAPSPNPFRLFEHGNVLEVEPNNSIAEATPAELPNALNGIISEPGDADFFKFEAKKGQVWEVECYARRIRSPLDPVMTVHRATGQQIAANDDSRGPDSYFRFQVPEDGEYVLGIRDHLGRGGVDFVYRVEFTPVQPALTLGIPRVTRYGQEQQRIVVPRGNRFATLISANRVNFGGEIVLDGGSLPEGLTMIAQPMAANMNLMPVVFEASADAAVAGGLIDFLGRPVDENIQIEGRFENRADLVFGAPGQSLYVTKDVNRLPVAVVDEVPFRLEIVQPNVPLVRNGSMQLKIVAHREEGFTAPITVQFPFRPPGLGTVPSATIPEGQNEVLYPLNANANAAVLEWPIYVIGQADVNGPAWVSSQMATLEIAEPFVQFAMERAAVEQGTETEIFVKVTHDKPFEGAAKVHLVGLPHKATAPELELTKDMEELTFKVTTEAESPVGIHKNVFCQVTITQNDEPIVQNAGSTELRIDKPLPPPTTPEPKAEPAPMPVAEAKPAEPPPKRLSRLEQLRLEAQKQAEAAEGGSKEE